jgi:hypothetical protein
MSRYPALPTPHLQRAPREKVGPNLVYTAGKTARAMSLPFASISAPGESATRSPLAAWLRFASPPRCHRLGYVHQPHGGSSLPDFDEVCDPDVEHLGQVEEHLERRVSDPPLKFLQVPVREALASDVLLTKSFPPARTAEVPSHASEESREVHMRTMRPRSTRIEPIGSACYALTGPSSRRDDLGHVKEDDKMTECRGMASRCTAAYGRLFAAALLFGVAACSSAGSATPPEAGTDGTARHSDGSTDSADGPSSHHDDATTDVDAEPSDAGGDRDAGRDAHGGDARPDVWEPPPDGGPCSWFLPWSVDAGSIPAPCDDSFFLCPTSASASVISSYCPPDSTATEWGLYEGEFKECCTGGVSDAGTGPCTPFLPWRVDAAVPSPCEETFLECPFPGPQPTTANCPPGQSPVEIGAEDVVHLADGGSSGTFLYCCSGP